MGNTAAPATALPPSTEEKTGSAQRLLRLHFDYQLWRHFQMDVFQSYATDEAKEVSGVWRDVGDAKLLIARSGNKKYGRLLSKLVEDNQALLDVKNDAADALSDKLMIDVMAETVLLGWKNLSFKGAALTDGYSSGDARTLLAVKDFRIAVDKLSREIDSYRVAQEAATEKN